MTDTILIVGGGIAGLHAAAECARAGARAIVVEQAPIIGGKLAAPMTEDAGMGDRAEGAGTPLLAQLAENENVEIMTLSNLESVEGRPGNFNVSIRERARFVTDDCTRCKLCRAVCPVVAPNEFDAGLTYRKAIYTPMGETLPAAWVIDIDDCLNTPPNYLPCNRCIEACDDDAIRFDLPLDRLHERQVGAVILAPGFRIEDGAGFEELGYGMHPDILMSAELQRLLESPGPTGGYASKPSNEEYPDRVLLVLDNLSKFALYIVASQVSQLLAQDVGKVAVLVLSQPATDGEFPEAIELAKQTGVQVAWGAMLRIDPDPDNSLNVSYEDFSAKRFVQDAYDIVVLCSDVTPPAGLAELAQTASVELTDDGYLATDSEHPDGVFTSSPGIFVAGCARGPRNIVDSISDAQVAAGAALAQLDPRLLETGTVPAEQQLPEQQPQASPDELREQIEQLLYALIGRTGS